MTYTWIITGGTQSTGGNTSSIKVIWGGGPLGTVDVTVTNSSTSCTATSSKAVTVNAAPAQPVITRNAGVLSVTPQAGATYQWYLDGNIIAGATNDSHNAHTFNGKYTVTVTLNGCKKTSDPYDYISTGVISNRVIHGINIYPNPNEGLFTITATLNKATNVKLIITDVSGRELISMDAGTRNGIFMQNIDASTLAKGVYFINIITEEGNSVRRVVIQ